MKVIILLSCFVAIALADGTGDFVEAMKVKLDKAIPECKTEEGVSDAELANLRKMQLPTTKEGKCFVACIGKKLNYISADGKLNKDQIDNFIKEAKDIDEDLGGKIQEITETCLKELKITSDICETVYNGYACFLREKDKKGFPAVEF